MRSSSLRFVFRILLLALLYVGVASHAMAQPAGAGPGGAAGAGPGGPGGGGGVPLAAAGAEAVRGGGSGTGGSGTHSPTSVIGDPDPVSAVQAASQAGRRSRRFMRGKDAPLHRQRPRRLRHGLARDRAATAARISRPAHYRRARGDQGAHGQDEEGGDRGGDECDRGGPQEHRLAQGRRSGCPKSRDARRLVRYTDFAGRRR